MTEHIHSNKIVSITKAELAKLPMACYTAGATIIDSNAGLVEAVEHLMAAHIVGFDTETRPSFRKGQSHSVSLLQLASPDRCYLFRLNLIGFPEILKNLLENPRVLKVGVSVKDDFHSLTKICELNPEGFVDLQQYVKMYDIADNSLSRIYAILFGKRISKGQRLSNWEADTLTQAQINYAAFDAVSCIRIYDYITQGKFDPAKSKYLREAEETQPA